MSLLMDALKKAEREKSKAASKKSTEESQTTSDSTDNAASSMPAENGAEAQSVQSGEQAAVTGTGSEQKDESWAFDTGELELEPLAQKSTSADEQEDNRTDLDDDTTVIESVSTHASPAPVDKKDDDITVKSETGLHKSDFDHDATLPSERAIQSSLKDYFEASQSITMDQGSVSTAVAPDITEHSVTSTSPLDTSATHVTAHTIFTAGQSRKASTGLAKYAIFGTLFLALGLGAVALYYSYVTPTTIDIPASLPTVAKMVETDEQPQTVEVDVNTADVGSPSGSASLEPEIEDPVLSEVVEEVASVTSEQNTGTGSDIVKDQAKEKTVNTQVVPFEPESVPGTGEVQQAEAPVTTQVTQQAAVAPQKAQPETGEITQHEPQVATQKEQPLAVEPEKIQSVIETRTVATQQPDHEVIYFPSNDRAQPEESIIQKDQQYQAGVVRGESTLNKTVTMEDKPIEVASAEDFAEGLEMPKNAIKITRGHTHRASRSNLSEAYQAYQSGDIQTAKGMYRKILNHRPDNRDARLGIAAIAVLEGNYETAYRHYQYLLQQNPKDQVVNAAMFNLQGNVGGTINESQLKLLLDQNPDSPQVHFSLGSFYAGQSRWPEAQKAFFDAFSADNKNADYAYNLAISLDQMGQHKSALSYYRTALKLAEQTPVSFNTSRVLARIQKLSGIVKN